MDIDVNLAFRNPYATTQGQIVSTYGIGCIISIYFGNKLGRVVAGLRIGQSTAVVPMWQAETSKHED
ncbi:uncharacterized protein Z519_02875 [Cladophialophora bantiana CBS 173.52]|uniref:Uncharacterized protein n=1 Tax=Cladophialophora bantiana (strain ATCC 10958 / CBS 173.52 / CDC B-1940 / NIH 8579) TaxID=1442370 RepID=A0A0D2F0Q0_CLAB1|nr:uncharacterized protein Z519_02875 [Cladophialophora bantiana CBS 173.52]KIW95811.1 hypothetical protein Z519_02875 [Cladophialophora bantiana CBS 173.52]